jgi:hypothetical protein
MPHEMQASWSRACARHDCPVRLLGYRTLQVQGCLMQVSRGTAKPQDARVIVQERSYRELFECSLESHLEACADPCFLAGSK